MLLIRMVKAMSNVDAIGFTAKDINNILVHGCNNIRQQAVKINVILTNYSVILYDLILYLNDATNYIQQLLSITTVKNKMKEFKNKDEDRHVQQLHEAANAILTVAKKSARFFGVLKINLIHQRSIKEMVC